MHQVDRALMGAAAQTQSVTPKPIIVVRFPSHLEAGVADKLREIYNVRGYYAFDRDMRFRKATPSSLDEALVKTSFYALVFHEILTRRLPEAAVLLQPSTLYLSDSSNINSQVYQKTELDALPALVVVDFFAYVDPKWILGGRQPNTTAGKRLVPIIAISTWPQLSQTTDGHVAGMHTLFGTPRVRSHKSHPTDAGTALSTNYLSMMNNAKVGDLDANSSHGEWYDKSKPNRPWTPQSHLRIPKLLIDMSLDDSNTDLESSNLPEFVARVARDIFRAAGESWNTESIRRTASVYDPDFGGDASRILPTAQDQKGGILVKFAEAETAFLEKQSLQLRLEMQNSEWHTSMIEMRSREQSFIRKETAKTYLTAVATGIVDGLTFSGIGDSIFNAQLENTPLRMASAFSSTRAQQLEISLTILGEDTRLVADSFAQLQARLKELYERMHPKTAPNTGRSVASIYQPNEGN